MKRATKRILYIAATGLVLVLLVTIGYLARYGTAINSMSPVETCYLVDSIYAVKDTYVNLYLLKDGNKYIAIDGGNDEAIVEKELQKLFIDPAQIMALFLTHTDGDHVAAVKLFRNAKVYLSEKEEQMINGQQPRFLVFRNSLGVNGYELLRDRQSLVIGNTGIEAISAPGHTPGSMCYLVNGKYLFTGDALSLKEGKIREFIRFINMDSKNAEQSINRIAELKGITYVFTAHFGYSNNFSNAVEGWREE
jgi:hydroxyacylglutathione hydrolase